MEHLAINLLIIILPNSVLLRFAVLSLPVTSSVSLSVSFSPLVSSMRQRTVTILAHTAFPLPFSSPGLWSLAEVSSFSLIRPGIMSRRARLRRRATPLFASVPNLPTLFMFRASSTRLLPTKSTSAHSFPQPPFSAHGPIALRVAFRRAIRICARPFSALRSRWCSSGLVSTSFSTTQLLSWSQLVPLRTHSSCHSSSLLSMCFLPLYLSIQWSALAAALFFSSALSACWYANSSSLVSVWQLALTRRILIPKTRITRSPTISRLSMLKLPSSVSTSSGSRLPGARVPGLSLARSSLFPSDLVVSVFRLPPTGFGTLSSPSSPLIWWALTRVIWSPPSSWSGVVSALVPLSTLTSLSLRQRVLLLNKSIRWWMRLLRVHQLSGSPILLLPAAVPTPEVSTSLPPSMFNLDEHFGPELISQMSHILSIPCLKTQKKEVDARMMFLWQYPIPINPSTMIYPREKS